VTQAELYTLAPVWLLGAMALWSFVPFYRRCLRPWIKGHQGEKRVCDLLRLYEFEILHGLYVPNAAGELAQVDIVVKLQNSIAVIEVKNLQGQIDGTDYDQNWVQIIDNKSWKIPNYYVQNQRQIRHVKHILPNVHVWGNVVFVGNVQTPHMSAPNVKTLENFRRYIAEYKTKYQLHEHSPEIDAAWLTLVDQAKHKTWEQRRDHRKLLRSWFGWDKRRVLITARFAMLSVGAVLAGVYAWGF